MSENETLLKFPCEFPVKVMGRSGTEFEAAVLAIVRRHAPDLADGGITARPSAQGNYVALSFVVKAESKEQLDALYRDLTACDQVVMAL